MQAGKIETSPHLLSFCPQDALPYLCRLKKNFINGS
jgi:hypothetical protein